MKKLQLPNVTLLGVDCVDVPRLQKALDISELRIEFAEVKLLSSITNDDSRWVEIPPIHTIEAYSEFCIRDLTQYVDTEYVLLVQWDGFILNPESWSDRFLEYDYIGAPWYIEEEFWFTQFNFPRSLAGQQVIGNGGFCVRSKKFLETSSCLATQGVFAEYQPEDVQLCVFKKEDMEAEGITYAPYEVAKDFAIEGTDEVYDSQFGFHGLQWTDISKWIEENKEWGIEMVERG